MVLPELMRATSMNTQAGSNTLVHPYEFHSVDKNQLWASYEKKRTAITSFSVQP